jgi:hypothetical protein
MKQVCAEADLRILGIGEDAMATTTLAPELPVQTEFRTDHRPDYKDWLLDVRGALMTMNIKMDTWQRNWEYDFRDEYASYATADDAAVHAHDFWWQQLLAESWT